jgi:hypothetical protein
VGSTSVFRRVIEGTYLKYREKSIGLAPPLPLLGSSSLT